MIYFCNDFSISQFINNHNMFNGSIPIMFMTMKKNQNVPNYLNMSSLVCAGEEITNSLGHAKTVGTGVHYIDPNVMYNVFESVDFDMLFLQSINNDTRLWAVLMNALIGAFNGYDVIIEYSLSFIDQQIVESVVKLIQEIYCYNCVIVVDPNDFISNSDFINTESFKSTGLLKFDEDKAKYIERFLTREISTDLVLPEMLSVDCKKNYV